MRCPAVLLLVLWPGVVRAELPVIVSAGPDRVAVTVYRDPDRSPGDTLDRARPAAFALIVETRTVSLPAGQTVVRFEGVASGIVPQTAILFGTDPRERNRDAALLSQKGLVDAFTGQRVTLRRTDAATGLVTNEDATIRSAADRLVVTTARGSEAIYCSGLHQTLLYPGVPQTLSAKPVLSMTTKDQPGGRMTITLAYLATGFDWDATYVGTIAPDGKSMALLGWLTLASADDTSFVDATTSAVAGRINRSADTRDEGSRAAASGAVGVNRSYACWPAKTTSDLEGPPPAPAMLVAVAPSADIIVTAQRRREEKALGAALAVTARSESLGDLKLYRIPLPVTVAARSQKQVAFMAKPKVAGTIVYRAHVRSGTPQEVEMLFRFRNRKQDGLGEPLPAGRAVLYRGANLGRLGPDRLFVGETSTADKAINEEVEFTFGSASGVTLEDEETASETPNGAPARADHRIVVRNANPFAVAFELEFPLNDEPTYGLPAGRIVHKPGKRVWTATIPANGTVVARYRAVERPD